MCIWNDISVWTSLYLFIYSSIHLRIYIYTYHTYTHTHLHIHIYTYTPGVLKPTNYWGGHNPPVRRSWACTRWKILFFWGFQTRFPIHCKSSFTKEYKCHKQMISTNIYFTVDFLVQPDEVPYKKSDCLKYWGYVPHFYYWGARFPARPLPAPMIYKYNQVYMHTCLRTYTYLNS